MIKKFILNLKRFNLIQIKIKDSELVATPLCLRNISKGWTVDNINNNELNGYVNNISADYDAIAIEDILDIS